VGLGELGEAGELGDLGARKVRLVWAPLAGDLARALFGLHVHQLVAGEQFLGLGERGLGDTNPRDQRDDREISGMTGR
jgi:hypothetical protein